MSLSKLNRTKKKIQGPLTGQMKKPARILAVVCAFLIIGALTVTQLPAQTPKPATPKPVTPPTNPKKDDGPPEPEHLILDTSDGVKLACTYFESPKSKDGKNGRSVIPIILLHDWDGDRRQLLEFGLFLQTAGHAVIVPDLRGHGESTQVAGVEKPIDATEFRKAEILSTLKDIERCKKYLIQRNNEGELNIDMLGVVAVGKTCVLAVQWTLNDWYAFPPYNPKGIKQGQDVKALMLVSPEKKLAGISMIANLKHPLFSGATGAALPTLLLWGASDPMSKESESIFKTLEKARPDLSKIESKAERFEKTTLFSVPVTKSQFAGVELMKTQRVNGLWAYMEKILFTRKIAAHADKLPWKSRDSKKSDD